MAGVPPGTASDIFGVVKDVGANVIMISKVSSRPISVQHFSCVVSHIWLVIGSNAG